MMLELVSSEWPGCVPELTARSAQVHAAHEKGMGSKAMLLLAGLAKEAEVLHVLRSLLQPQDYACLVSIARCAVSTMLQHILLRILHSTMHLSCCVLNQTGSCIHVV